MDTYIIDIIKNFFKDQPVKKAFIFGSYIKNEQNRSSDIDILVELDHTFPIGLKFIEMQSELENILKLKVDLVTDKSLSKYIKPLVDTEKVLVYEKQN
jgi:uncharacterized protein